MAVWDRINVSLPRPSRLKKTALSFLHNKWLLLSSLPVPGPTLSKRLPSAASLLETKCPGSIVLSFCWSECLVTSFPPFVFGFYPCILQYPSHSKLLVEYLEDSQIITKQTKPESHHPRMTIISLGRFSLLVFSPIKVHSKHYEIHIALWLHQILLNSEHELAVLKSFEKAWKF